MNPQIPQIPNQLPLLEATEDIQKRFQIDRIVERIASAVHSELNEKGQDWAITPAGEFCTIY